MTLLSVSPYAGKRSIAHKRERTNEGERVKDIFAGTSCWSAYTSSCYLREIMTLLEQVMRKALPLLRLALVKEVKEVETRVGKVEALVALLRVPEWSLEGA